MSEKLSFEQALSKLEEIVSALEEGETSLEESMKLFEEGVGLVRECNTQLKNAEKKVKKLTESADGELAEEDFLPMGD